MAWTILVEGHQRNSSAKLYGNLSSGFWEVFNFFFLFDAIATRILHGFQIYNFQPVSPKDHSSEIWLKLAQWLEGDAIHGNCGWMDGWKDGWMVRDDQRSQQISLSFWLRWAKKAQYLVEKVYHLGFCIDTPITKDEWAKKSKGVFWAMWTVKIQISLLIHSQISAFPVYWQNQQLL